MIIRKKFQVVGTLTKLESEYAIHGSFGAPSNQTGFYEALSSATLGGAATNKEDALRVIHYWLHEFYKLAVGLNSPHMYAHNIDKFVAYILNNEALTDIDSNPQDRMKMMAICATRVFIASHGGAYPDNNPLAKLLEQWLGEKPGAATLESLRQFIPYAYAPGVWELYANDVEREYELAHYLCDNNAPLRVKLPAAANQVILGENALPNDVLTDRGVS